MNTVAVTSYLAGDFSTVETTNVDKTVRSIVANGGTILSIFRS